MWKKVEAFCKKNHLFSPGDALVIACSGGPDSLALVHVFMQLQERWNLRLQVAHFEHGIRGEASKADAAFVQAFCQQNHLPFAMEAADVPGYARREKLSEETAARELRYAFLRKISRQMGGAKLVTAHHANDQAETVLMHLFRGAGIEGLAGMRPKMGDIIRPFLCLTRPEIEAYCQEKGLAPRHDVTNDDPAYTRNRIRLRLLPQLIRDYNPEIVAALCRTAEIAAGTEEFLQQAARKAGRHIGEETADGFCLDCQAFRDLPLALQRMTLRQVLERFQGNALGTGFEQFEDLRGFLCAGRTGQHLDFSRGISVQISYERAFFSRREIRPEVSRPQPVFLQVPGQNMLPDFGYSLTASFTTRPLAFDGKWRIFCDGERLPGPLSVRTRRPGDRICLEAGEKKLKDFLIDQKIPRTVRDHLPIICAGDAILWIGGVRQTMLARIGKDTQCFLQLELQKNK